MTKFLETCQSKNHVCMKKIVQRVLRVITNTANSIISCLYLPKKSNFSLLCMEKFQVIMLLFTVLRIYICMVKKDSECYNSLSICSLSPLPV